MDSIPPVEPESNSNIVNPMGNPVHGNHEEGMIGGWLRRNHSRITAGCAALLLFLAVLAPVISPVDQRGEVVIITILFGLTGSLMLYSAADSGGLKEAVPHPVRLRERQTQPATVPARIALRQRRSRQTRNRTLIGLVFGLLFTITGAVAPFVLSEGNANPDARFLMMLGFSPIAISGGLMVMVFGRTFRARSGSSTPPQGKAPVRQTPESSTDSVPYALATVGVVSGILLTVCALVLPFVVNVGMHESAATASLLMGVVGLTLALASGWVLRRARLAAPEAAKSVTRRAPVPRVPAGALFRVVLPVAIVLLLILIVVVILVIAAATVTPLIR